MPLHVVYSELPITTHDSHTSGDIDWSVPLSSERPLWMKVLSGVFFCIGIFCLWKAIPRGTPGMDSTAIAAPAAPEAPITPEIEKTAIQNVRIGQRVLARNPEVTDSDRAAWGPEPEFEQWLHLSLEMPKEDGSTLHVEMLRPHSWFESQVSYVVQETDAAKEQSPVEESGNTSTAAPDTLVPLAPLRRVYYEVAAAGATIEAHGYQFVSMVVQMDLPELGLTGNAIVRDIQASPQIEPLQGHRDTRRVVTATFRHSSADVIDLVVADRDGEEETIGTTSNHPFWSVDREDYVQAGSLNEGERLQTLHGDTKTVVSQLPRPGPTEVYNLEVHGEHTYFVGEDAVLVHNSRAYNSDLDGIDDFADLDFVGQKVQGRKLGIDPLDNFDEVRLHGNRLDSPGEHVVYVLRENGTGRVLHFGEAADSQRRLRQHLRDARNGTGVFGDVPAPTAGFEMEILRTVNGKAAAKRLESRYNDTFMDVFKQRPPNNRSRH